MSATDVTDMLRDLELFFGPRFKPTPDQEVFYIKEFRDINVDYLVWASFQVKNKGLYPSAQIIKEHVTKAREALWQKEKEAHAKPTLPPRGTSGLIKEGMPLVWALLDGKISREEYLERYRALGIKYPNRGVHESAEAMEKWWREFDERKAKQDRDNSEPPAGETANELGTMPVSEDSPLRRQDF